jgi:hypothetical protein
VILPSSILRLLRKQPNHNIQISQMLVGLCSDSNHHPYLLRVYSRNFTLHLPCGGACLVILLYFRYCDCYGNNPIRTSRYHICWWGSSVIRITIPVYL